MALMPHVWASSTGSFAIRAPLTPDDNDGDSASEFEFDSHEKAYNMDSSSSIYDGFESEEYVSGEEFESASEEIFIADPDEENKVKIFRPVVANPYEKSLKITADDDEESGLTDEYGSVVDSDSPVLPRVMPIAHLSMDDDEFHELLSVEGIERGELEDNSFAGIVKVPSILDKIITAPSVEVSDLEDDKEIGLLVQVDSSVVSDTQLLALGEDNDFRSELVGVDNGALSGKYGKFGVEDECLVILSETNVGPFLERKNVDLEENSELNEDVKSVLNDSFSVELVGEYGSVFVPDGHVEALIDRSFLERNLKSDMLFVKGRLPFESSQQEKIALYGEDEQDATSIGNDFVDQVFDESQLHQVGTGNEPEMLESDTLVSQDSAESFGIIREELTDSEEQKRLFPDGDIEDMNEHAMNELSISFSSSPQVDGIHNELQKVDIVSEPDEELETGKKLEEKKLSNHAAFAARLMDAASAESDGDRTRVTAANGRVFSAEDPAESVSSLNTKAHASQSDMVKDVVNDNASVEEKNIIIKIQHIRVKFLRLVHRLGFSPEDSVVVQVLYRLVLAAGIHVRHNFSNVFCSRMALQLEAEGKDHLDFSLNILVIGKTGVGKSATINSIFGEKKVMINAFEPATTEVTEIVEKIDGVRIRILDTPGLRTCVKEEATNRKILASIKKVTKKFPPDVILYVDRLDTHGGDLNDLSLLASISNALTASIWRNAIVTLTHAAAPPPEGPFGSPLSFEMFVAQRAQVIQQAISQAAGDMHLMHPQMMRPVSLVENHPSCCKNGSGEGVLPNGQIWRFQLLLLCYSLKILSEASPESKTQHSFEKLPLPSLVSYLLESRPHPKLTVELDGDDVHSDMELLALSDHDEHDYDQLLPFKSLKKSQVYKLSKEQRKACTEEDDYRVKDHGRTEKDLDQKDGGLDHDIGCDGVGLEGNLAIAGQFPGAFAVQITKDKEQLNILLNSSIGAKHGENGSTMTGFDIQTIGRKLAHILRSETKFNNLELKETSAGMCITQSGKNMATGLKIKDGITVRNRLALVGTAGAVRSGSDAAYGANFEVHLKGKDFHLEQDQTILSLSLMKWRSDFCLMTSLQFEYSVCRDSKTVIGFGMNSKRNGQISIKTSSSELQVALICIVPMVVSILRRF